MFRGYVVDKSGAIRKPIIGRLVIGRAEDADWRIEDPVASRHHVELIEDAQAFLWRDLGSSNGTLINGAAATSGILHHGDVLRIGETVLCFESEEDRRSRRGTAASGVFEATVLNASAFAKPAPDLYKSCSLLDTLYQVMNEIATHYDPCVLLDRILETAMPTINAQRGAVFLTNEAQAIIPCPNCHHVHSYLNGRLAPAEQQGLAISSTVANRVLSNGECLLFQDCDTDGVLQTAQSVMSLNLRSIICVPLRAKSRILGILYVDTNRPGHAYDQEDLLLAIAVGNSAGIALENVFMHRQLLEKQRIEQEIETAWAIQEGFLCREWDFGDGRFEVYGDTTPAKTVGGDFYDCVRPNAHTVGILIGDVSGKGVPAALTMAQLLAEFRLFARDISSPAAVLARLNAGLVKRSRRGLFCTLCYASVDLRTGVLVWANAGHLPGLMTASGGAQFICEAGGPPVGIIETALWEESRCVMEPGATLLFFTDGIVEARPPTPGADEFGMDRLQDTPGYEMAPREMLNTVSHAMRQYLEGAEPHDDCTMIALRYLGHEQRD